MKTEKKRRIGLPATAIHESYDCVVIGSGYGGGIAASRMSRAGKRVALFERGEERWPGEYPSSLPLCAPELAVHARDGTTLGKRNGLYQLHLGKNQNVFVANGLGGTSLLNANVALRADERTLGLDVWPRELREDPKALDKYYQRAEAMLEPVPYPADAPPLPKLELLEQQAALLGPEYSERFYRPPITVTFEERLNAAGVMQQPSTLQGNDTTGVNDGSKNSTLVNYISDAWNHGCEIFCEIEARYILYSEPLKKWVVFYAALAFGRSSFSEDLNSALQFVLCDQVFLGAGTLGTNEILLRSQSMGLKVSPRLGTNFSGNGDILAFAYNTDLEANAIGMPGTLPPSKFSNGPVGPCITGVIDMRDATAAPNVLDGYVIEEGVVPHALADVLGTILNLTPGKVLPNLGLADWVKHAARQAATRAFGPYAGALKHTQTYLIMSHDDGQGDLTLANDTLDVAFADVGREQHIQHLNDTLAKATGAVKGTYVPGPFCSPLWGTSLISVHPVGGAAMGDSGEVAVTNHRGQVFTGKGKEVHEGLFVTDGAVIPTPLGVNPFLTISALAERTVDLAAQDMDASIDLSRVLTPINFERPEHAYMSAAHGVRDGRQVEGGISFSEAMEGYFSTVVKSEDVSMPDYQNAAAQAKSSDSRMRFMLSVIAYDLNALIDMNCHEADIMGTVSCRALSAHAMSVTSGRFRLFTADPVRTDTQNLVYELDLLSVEGCAYTLTGFKVVDNSAKLNLGRLWEQTTTLYVKVERRLQKANAVVNGNGTTTAASHVVGLGVLTMTVADFTKELASFKTYNSKTGLGFWTAVEFTNFFAKNLFTHFLPNLARLQYPEDPHECHIYRKTRPIEESWMLSVPAHIPAHPGDENIQIELVRWNGGGKGPILLIPGAAVTQNIFSTQLINDNFVDWILARGYDVFALNHRLSPNLPASLLQFTVDDVRIDIAYAIQRVREITGVEKLSVVAHCVGAVGLTMGLLDGLSEGVGAALLSQVSMHPVGGFINNIKSTLHASQIWRYGFGQNFFDSRATRSETLFDKALDQVLRFYPTVPKEVCSNASCHRQSFLFGRLWSHGNLDPNLHANIDKMLGGANMTTMSQLSMMSRNKKISDHEGKNVYVTEENIKTRFNMPITFIHGDDNVVFDPKGTKLTYDLVRSINGPDKYARYTFPGMGHLDTWLGQGSAKYVFPVVLNHLEAAELKHGVGYAGMGYAGVGYAGTRR
ncbi:FAD/NAD(P)-binding domain-containing protein [Calocera viscosa TUFC12733]|uniref:Cholesterol oxidase n=1 Tax=Calocera viscosa (strain TUFC12733) TaxID=1330018 RepID=A0A167ILU5_CALVF|nr:FAD/NAD(P)-binding domain-containing protein [Calocera viscosa TUFC12733]